MGTHPGGEDMGASAGTAQVLEALARFRTSDTQMHQRVRATASLGENELRILDFLLREHRDARVVKPSEISRHLSISSASTTALLDRLERQGSVQRVNHPTDRRSILIEPTPKAEQEVADLVDAFEEQAAEVADSLGPEGRAAVIAFLTSVADAAEHIGTAERARSYALR